MKVELENLFSIDESSQDQVINVYNRHGIAVGAPEIKKRNLKTKFNPIFTLNEEITYEHVTALYESLERELGIVSIGERFYFEFSEQEYKQAPLFTLNSTGNSPEMFVEDKGTLFSLSTHCKSCGLMAKEQLSPIVIDTSQMKDRHLVHVSGYWVASQNLVSIMKQENLGGYELLEVIHQGPEEGKQLAYQIIPTQILPSCSSDRIKLYFATEQPPCSCGLNGVINGPDIYHRKDLSNVQGDVFYAAEWSHDGRYLYRKTLFSKRFREAIIRHNISRDVRGEKDSNFGPKDWLFDPVLIQ
ncbi:hypothetical protein I6G82_21465 [Lysinibacillus macroides]|uniref:Uncharacterized protein n=1 Tax=Lysinibacillus macroides TaxID=33935 RepID=A0A0M9DFH6_9BACI|nr:hypothetical protein [Lysinibacillus macroides]KOY80418.1 hypothetical protein ADM90_21540 [Lysinibacillus macroides]QPR67730.1 hypothetical protein I6G82_21465 [Lysinibacillus macroides]